jgi:hypothetical protein
MFAPVRGELVEPFVVSSSNHERQHFDKHVLSVRSSFDKLRTSGSEGLSANGTGKAT